MDDQAGGDVRDRDGFLDDGSGGEGRGQVRGDGIACAHDVDLATHGQGRDMRRLAVGRGSDDAALGEGDEDIALMLPGQGGCGVFDFLQAQVAVRARECGQFGAFILRQTGG